MDLHELRFSSAEVAAAIGMTHDNFRAHLSRKGWRIVGKPQPESGKGHHFSFNDVLGYALARRLGDFGIEPKVAFERAFNDFAHASDEERREPGGVFDFDQFGLTLYVYSPDYESGWCVATKWIPDAGLVLPVSFTGLADAAIVIQLNTLRLRVFGALGLDWSEFETARQRPRHIDDECCAERLSVASAEA